MESTKPAQIDTLPGHEPPRAIVIGGSLGGLTTAAALRAVGWEVDVFEASPNELESRGGGVVLQPDVTEALSFAGVALPQPHGVKSIDRIYLNDHDAVTNLVFMPQMQTSWSLLYKALRRAQPIGRLHAGEKLVAIEHDGPRVTARFESGRTAQGDLLIGADGVRSTVRSLLRPDVMPEYSGYVAWRGLIDEPNLPAFAASTLRDRFAFEDGVGHSALSYLIPGEDDSTEPGRRRWNWVWYRRYDAEELKSLLVDRDGLQRPFSLPPGTMKDADIAQLKADAEVMLGPTFRALVQSTETPFMQPIVDLLAPGMVFGNVILTGDAASVPRPHTAGSTAKAAFNAHALALQLARVAQAEGPRATVLEHALRRWEAEQLRIGRGMIQRGIMLGNRLMLVPARTTVAG
jgi:2-polyprenyl-6-methoxyphenol hydroxylase-like FAD-dependent oxidoreductase